MSAPITATTVLATLTTDFLGSEFIATLPSSVITYNTNSLINSLSTLDYFIK
ncbi:hypothetical protein [Borrelia turicatae]|uniref:hypothetical protein n=1 Tax=Borrelia turicatae TaxID=142 RepID=UPI001FF3526A|nr:hypothetical protein [Borrelia turicatae]